VFVGLSVAGAVTPEMLVTMAERPIVFALANPDPEIGWKEAKAARSDVIMATGRSDFPNQVNNVLGFPFIFRGALDVRASEINKEMKLAACRGLAEMARKDVPDSVLKAYDLDRLRFGPDYLIPKPFDFRVLLEIPVAVAQAAMETGVARIQIDDFDAYRQTLETLVSRRLEVMRRLVERAKSDPKRVVFPEGEHDKILRAAKILVDEGIAHPILLARRDRIAAKMEELGIDESDVTIIHVTESEKKEQYAELLHHLRRREGVSLEDAQKLLKSRNYFGPMMIVAGDADGVISGLSQDYPATIRPALEVIGTAEGVRRVMGAYILMLEDRLLFLADTTVNIDPTAEELAEIAIMTASFARRFDVEPRVGMLSFSNFGSNHHPSARKVRQAVEIAKNLDPELVIDGEMQADTAVLESILEERYPWSDLRAAANVLIFPELNSANIAYKLIWRLAHAEAIGPVLLGMAKPVHVLQRGSEVTEIVNMAALCVADAQDALGIPKKS
jgi:malate dehydrogenase (oxaloacetate-decarboxylating)(NADP+)